MRVEESLIYRSDRRTRGFTLVEVVVCIAITALMFMGIITAYIHGTYKAEWSGYSLAAQAMAIQQLEQVYVDMTWSSSEVLDLRRALDAGEIQAGAQAANVTITLEDGRAYDQPGTLQFTDVSVDQTTGALGLRALVPNPRVVLLPGMFVRARIEEGVRSNAFLVPQIAVSRDSKGVATVMLVGAGNKVEQRMLTTDRAVGNQWLVSAGIASGDRVIVAGLQWVQPGVEVKPVPANAAPAPAVALSTTH